MVDVDGGGAGGAQVVEEDEVLRIDEVLRVYGILNEEEFDDPYVKADFFAGFAFHGVSDGFAVFDVAAGDRVLVPPLVGLDEENLAVGVADEGADGGDGLGFHGGWMRGWGWI